MAIEIPLQAGLQMEWISFDCRCLLPDCNDDPRETAAAPDVPAHVGDMTFLPLLIVWTRFPIMMDLQALGGLLKQTHRGYFIPPRPEKNAVEGQRGSPEFVEQRRAALEYWLQQLAFHPVIGASEVAILLTPAPSSPTADLPLRPAHWKSAATLTDPLFDLCPPPWSASPDHTVKQASGVWNQGSHPCDDTGGTLPRGESPPLPCWVQPSSGCSPLSMPRMQELRVFLEADGVLALAPEWRQLQPASGNLLDGVTRLPKQLFGAHSPRGAIYWGLSARDMGLTEMFYGNVLLE